MYAHYGPSLLLGNNYLLKDSTEVKALRSPCIVYPAHKLQLIDQEELVTKSKDMTFDSGSNPSISLEIGMRIIKKKKKEDISRKS